jgi:hypothetical protein
MARGGHIHLEVEGSIYPETDGAGQKHYRVEIQSIKWPRGKIVNQDLIASMDQVEESFLETTYANKRD